MTTNLLKLNFENETIESNIHSLPCKIHFNGEAKISEYFNPSVATESEELNVSFRGYPLNGKVLPLPDSYHGLVLKADKPGSMTPVQKFDSLTYWDWDRRPSRNDSFLSALDWLSLSSQVHDPVEDD